MSANCEAFGLYGFELRCFFTLKIRLQVWRCTAVILSWGRQKDHRFTKKDANDLYGKLVLFFAILRVFVLLNSSCAEIFSLGKSSVLGCIVKIN